MSHSISLLALVLFSKNSLLLSPFAIEPTSVMLASEMMLDQPTYLLPKELPIFNVPRHGGGASL